MSEEDSVAADDDSSIDVGDADANAVLFSFGFLELDCNAIAGSARARTKFHPRRAAAGAQTCQ